MSLTREEKDKIVRACIKYVSSNYADIIYDNNDYYENRQYDNFLRKALPDFIGMIAFIAFRNNIEIKKKNLLFLFKQFNTLLSTYIGEYRKLIPNSFEWGFNKYTLSQISKRLLLYSIYIKTGVKYSLNSYVDEYSISVKGNNKDIETEFFKQFVNYNKKEINERLNYFRESNKRKIDYCQIIA